ncbi:MAG TPA: PCRF domain-containing protein [Phycisphaerales bacterium]|nr:PCRF domain-containing protein [Phycisphaerales bacterium]HMP36489.1 PCRF domain-containing protein [Phycisphaerales bacterium]
MTYDLAPNLRRKLEELEAGLDEVAARLLDPAVVSDHRQVRALSIRQAALAPTVEAFRSWRATIAGVAECEAAIEGDDPDLATLAEEELPILRERAARLVDDLLARLVTSEDAAIDAVILEIRAGVGGDEAALWAGDLLAMYQAYAERRGWGVLPLELSPGEVGGVKSIMLNVRGPGVWSGLAFESGTHQVKRVPATEAQGRVHTSTATVAVLPEPEEIEVQIAPEEVKEIVTTAQGPGGQNVNKVSTAVHLIHLPTGIEVRMQETKSQGQNRERAWKILRARIHERQRAEAHARRTEHRNSLIGQGARAEKIRTYRYKENVVVDHRIETSFNLQRALAGELDEIVEALTRREIAERIAAM